MQAIQCPVGNTTLEYKFQGSGPYYIKLQVRNARWTLEIFFTCILYNTRKKWYTFKLNSYCRCLWLVDTVFWISLNFNRLNICRIPPTKVEIYQPKWRQWTPLAHTTDGFWTFGTEPVERPVKPPFRIRLTAANGERIVDSVPDLGKHSISASILTN